MQSSLWPEVKPDVAVGPLQGSVVSGNNSDLMVAVRELYLTGSVLDVTFGKGLWWRRFTPEVFAFHDIASDGVDFTALPEADSSFDAVCFDPPYIVSGGLSDARVAESFRERFGITTRTEEALWEMIADGLAECCRVSARWVLVKCGDYTSSGRFVLGHRNVLNLAEELGAKVHDLVVHHTGSGPGGHNIVTPLRTRRHHSYLIVLKVDG